MNLCCCYKELTKYTCLICDIYVCNLCPSSKRLSIRTKNNVCNPYSIGLYTRLQGKIELESLVVHLPREISRFCKFYLEYKGELMAIVHDTNFCRYSLPKGGLEIPVTLIV